MSGKRALTAEEIRRLADSIPGLAESEPHLKPQALAIRRALYELASGGTVKTVVLDLEGKQYEITLKK